jgi:hypothetical protein
MPVKALEEVSPVSLDALNAILVWSVLDLARLSIALFGAAHRTGGSQRGCSRSQPESEVLES